MHLQKDYPSTNPGMGVNVGIIYLCKMNSFFDFESGIFYRQKGQKYNQNFRVLTIDGYIADVEGKNEYRLNYMQLPLNLIYKFNSDVLPQEVYIWLMDWIAIIS
ncbi:MAG: PorT family protein [Bacteroidales bacterium]|nr:PorT family protein [Bacteroidales bacterium]